LRVGLGLYKEIRNPTAGRLVAGAVGAGHLAFGTLLTRAAVSQAITGTSIATGGVGGLFLATGLLVSSFIFKKDLVDQNSSYKGPLPIF
jgi:hypothetical protein